MKQKSSAWRSPWAKYGGRGRSQWAKWVRDLSGKSGVYVIRLKGSRVVVYVGQSHTGRLKKTMIRHFQHWKGNNAGPTYPRGRVEVKVILAPKRVPMILKIEQECLYRLKPRDNETGWPDEVPF